MGKNEKKYSTITKEYYFTGIVPKSGYTGVIFTCQNKDIGNWENCDTKTINIVHNYSRQNAYCFNGKDNNGKITGNWILL